MDDFNELTQRNLPTLITVKKQLETLGLKPILIASTLLGIYRDKQLLGMPELAYLYEDWKDEYLGRWREIAGHPIGISKNDSLEPNCIFNTEEDGVYVEIHCIYRYGNKAYVNLTTDNCLVWPRRHFDNLQEIEFADEKWYAPSDIENYLKRQYGDWRTPQTSSWYNAPNRRRLRIDKKGRKYFLKEH